jgi:hypothetical protein
LPKNAVILFVSVREETGALPPEVQGNLFADILPTVEMTTSVFRDAAMHSIVPFYKVQTGIKLQKCNLIIIKIQKCIEKS